MHVIVIVTHQCCQFQLKQQSCDLRHQHLICLLICLMLYLFVYL